MWRYLRPIEGRVKAVFAGDRHFLAALQTTRAVLDARRGESSSSSDLIDLTQVPASELAAEIVDAHLVFPFMERIDATLLRAAGKELRAVCQFGVGLEGVDQGVATELGIAVANTPSPQNAAGTAEHALFLLMSLMRHGPSQLEARFRRRELGGLPIPRQLSGKKACVLGFGAVGQRLCALLVHHGMKVTAVRRTAWPSEAWTMADNCINTLGLERRGTIDEVKDLARGADALLLALPLNAATDRVVDGALIDVLAPGAVVVNVGRGGLVEHGAMLSGLDDGHVSGFASDVGVGHPSKAPEPWDPVDALSQHPNTIFTPHVGGYCDGSYADMAQQAADTILAVQSGRPPPVFVNRPCDDAGDEPVASAAAAM